MKSNLIFLLFLAQLCFGQREGNMWYFGQNAGLNFNSGTPVPFTGSAMNTLEGCASISDSLGNPLFYTNGLKVWNRANLQMPNGFGLLGDDNSAQSAVIVKAPGSNSLYYIFTAPTSGTSPLRYNVVDMSLQSGFGDVTTKNVALFNNSTEKVTAVYNSNRTGFWVIGHEFGSNKFYAYLITSAGVSVTPVVSSSGTSHNGSPLAFAGYMKASHDGHKLACAVTINMNFVELFDFDNTNGTVSNPITFTNIMAAYGIEFSPDDSKLYATEENPKHIIQWDLSSGSPATITSSKTIVATSSVECAALQLAPDGKIYLAKRNNNYLGAINSPDLPGLACNYNDTALKLPSPTTNRYGLPNFFQSIFRKQVAPIANFNSEDTSICPGTCIGFRNLSVNATTYQWRFPGATPLSDTSQTPINICYDSPGQYDVQLIASNGSVSDTLRLENYIVVQSLPEAGAVAADPDSVCYGNPSQLNVSGSQGFIQWQVSGDGVSFNDLPGDTFPNYTTSNLFQNAFYRVKASDNCGSDSSEVVQVIVNPLPIPVVTADDTVFCSGDSTLVCLSNSFTSYYWNTGDSSVCTYAKVPGGYWLTVTDGNGCSAISERRNISVYPTPSVSIIVQGDTLSSFGAVSYQWYFDGSEIAGATGAIHIAQQSGEYALEITDANGCVARSNGFSVVINDIPSINSDGILVYPNPFTDAIYIRFTQPLPVREIKMFDVLGRITWLGESIDNFRMDASGLTSGVYYLKITTTRSEYCFPLVKIEQSP